MHIWTKKNHEHSAYEKVMRYGYPEPLTSVFDNITENSIVFDLGGYEGGWTSIIEKLYKPNVHIFEPVSSFYNNCSNRFSFQHNQNIHIHKFGLASSNSERIIYINRDSTSLFINDESQLPSGVKITNTTEQIELVQYEKFIKEHNIHNVDLLKMNIEGAEYDLLDYLIETTLIKNIKQFIVQFHSFYPDAKQRMNKIHTGLSKTHEPIYQFEFIWEHWRLK